VVRGEIVHLPSPRGARGQEHGGRYAVIVQADEFLGLSTTLAAPTSVSCTASFRPSITVGGQETRVLVEQTTVVDPERLGRSAGRLEAAELRAVDEALRLVLACRTRIETKPHAGGTRRSACCFVLGLPDMPQYRGSLRPRIALDQRAPPAKRHSETSS
jgi:mRNA interferase MazF